MLARSLIVTAGLAGIACSDPATLPPEGGYTITIGQQTGMPCSGTGPPFSVPSGNDPYSEITNPQSVGDTSKETPERYAFRADGDEGFDVKCSVVPMGDNAFDVNLDLHSRTVQFAVAGQLMGQVSTGAYITEQHEAAAGSISGGIGLSQKGCKISIRTRTDDKGNKVGVIGPGYIWAKYECDQFNDEPNDYCTAEGTFVFQNCAKK